MFTCINRVFLFRETIAFIYSVEKVMSIFFSVPNNDYFQIVYMVTKLYCKTLKYMNYACLKFQMAVNSLCSSPISHLKNYFSTMKYRR